MADRRRRRIAYTLKTERRRTNRQQWRPPIRADRRRLTDNLCKRSIQRDALDLRAVELDTSVFVVPREIVKNKEDRLIVLNKIARSVIDEARGKHPLRVFTYRGQPVQRLGNSGWQRARKRAAARYAAELGASCPDGFRRSRVHDLKHTYGRRLRAAGVSFEDRQDLLGHKTGKVTTEYSAPELASLIEASNRVCGEGSRKTPALTLIRTARTIASR